MTEHFGDLLKKQRQQKSLTIQRLCGALQVPATDLLEVEENLRLPSKILLEQLAAYPELGLPYSTLRDWRSQELGMPPYQNKAWTCPSCGWPKVVSQVIPLQEEDLPYW